MVRVPLKKVHATAIAETEHGLVVQVQRDWKTLADRDSLVLAQVSPRASTAEIVDTLRELADALEADA